MIMPEQSPSDIADETGEELLDEDLSSSLRRAQRFLNARDPEAAISVLEKAQSRFGKSLRLARTSPKRIRMLIVISRRYGNTMKLFA